MTSETENTRLIAEEASKTPRTVAEVVSRLTSIHQLASDTGPRDKDDGIACFTELYKVISEDAQGKLKQDEFKAPNFLNTLLIEFAKRYFDALVSWHQEPSRTPRCWQVLFKDRADEKFTRQQFAGAGVNAHICFDLPFALLATWEQVEKEPIDGDQHEDFLKVNEIFDRNMRALLTNLDPGNTLFDWFEELVDLTAVAVSRNFAWDVAESLWPRRHDDKVMKAKQRSLDALTRLSGLGALNLPNIL